jgi:hypothetical protein
VKVPLLRVAEQSILYLDIEQPYMRTADSKVPAKDQLHNLNMLVQGIPSPIFQASLGGFGSLCAHVARGINFSLTNFPIDTSTQQT